jgi:3-hydroxyacyl-[acyl-carrier-protein] dehydratase
MVMEYQKILDQLPYGKSFLFVDELLFIDESSVKGTYTYHQDLAFYQDHFNDFPVTPGVILTETMAQIGLVCLGIYLLREFTTASSFAMTSNSIDFIKAVYPTEKVTVTSKKNYFRFNKLSCDVKMENELGEIVCKGNIAGMISNGKNG